MLRVASGLAVEPVVSVKAQLHPTAWMAAQSETLMKCMTRLRIYIGAHHCKKPIDRARRKLHEPAWLARCSRPLCFESGGIITPKLCR